jgi:hypothetical protein
VTSECCAHCHERGISIAHLTHENNIWILAHERLHTTQPIQPRAFTNLTLANERQLILHRIFQRHDIGINIIDET